jgi:large subunit ribosomal protein L10e
VLKGRNYRAPSGQPYTRGKYIHGSPALRISKFTMGDTKTSYDYKVSLVVQAPIQVRHNALEAARIAANKVLFDVLGETGYVVRLRPFPHIILRENRMIATAGADRLQEGMRRSFGKPSGRAARLRAGQPILDLYVNQPHVDLAKEALKVSSSKLGATCRVVVERAIPQSAA